MMSVQPDVTLQLAMSVISNISSYVRSIDFALDWVLIESGHALYRQVLYTVQYSTVQYISLQGEEADCTFVVLSGRLRSVVQRGDGRKELVGEFGR